MEYSVLYLEIGFNFINKIFKEMVTKWFYWCEFWQNRRVEFYAEIYLSSSIDDEDCPNFLK